jgi:hypothetical protein
VPRDALLTTQFSTGHRRGRGQLEPFYSTRQHVKNGREEAQK